jgi:hypothetical protein
VSPNDQDSDSSASALSDGLKEAVKSWVPKIRKVLDDDFGAQLSRLGIRRDGRNVSMGLRHLRSLI